MTGTDDSSGAGAPGIFEMLWDCAYCGTRGLLGQSHRHCPKCGAPQDPQRRYFPPLGQEVAARNTTYDGADRTCPACATPCGARAQHCPNCGSPLAAAREVVRRPDPLASAVATAASPPAGAAGRRQRLLAFLLLALGALALVVFLLSWKKEATVRVAGHAWKREIAIERLEAVSESSWCDQLPGRGLPSHPEPRGPLAPPGAGGRALPHRQHRSRRRHLRAARGMRAGLPRRAGVRPVAATSGSIAGAPRARSPPADRASSPSRAGRPRGSPPPAPAAAASARERAASATW